MGHDREAETPRPLSEPAVIESKLPGVEGEEPEPTDVEDADDAEGDEEAGDGEVGTGDSDDDVPPRDPETGQFVSE